MAKPLISVVVLSGEIIDKKLYEKCLDSLSWCSEIVKVNTVSINGSFSEWRNEGLKRAKGDWVLYVDTDEMVDKDLRFEIEKKTIEKDFVAYAIPRRNFIFGSEFKHSGQYPDYQKRLFKKSSLKKWQGNLHEEPVFEGAMGYLENPLLHYKNITISQMLEKTNKWSEIEAQLLVESHHPKMNIFRFASVALREFFLRMIKQMAFLDGTKGIIYAIYQVYSRLITYSKLWEKQLS